jgi:rod shape-determining protein MreC
MKYVAISICIIILGLFGLLNPVRELFLTLYVPIQFGLGSSAKSLKDGILFYTQVSSIREENLSLLQQLNDQKAEIANLKTLASENEVLRKQLGLVERSTEKHESLLVDVIGNSDDLSNTTLLINAGYAQGIHQGDMVVVGQYLIGTIKSVTSSSSIIELITSPQLSFTSYDLDAKNQTKGLIVGRHNSVMLFDRILPNDELKVGDTIVTLGNEGLFLPNFIVGKVIEVNSDSSQPLKSATVKTEIDFSKLTQVFILRIK